MDYHIFKKPTKSKNKIIHKWYYYFNDPVSGKQIQKVCKNCRTQCEALTFVSALPLLFQQEKITIATIAKNMYIPNGPHMVRMEKLGKTYDLQTIKTKLHQLSIFVSQFGHLELQNLTVPMVIDYLGEDNHSGSWKNNFLTIVNEVYAEAPFCGCNYIVTPKFPTFRRNTPKKDIFNTEELNALFDENLWITMTKEKYVKTPQFNEDYRSIYLMFLCCAKCGLRIGEAIGLRVQQFLFDQGMLFIDGFYKHNTLERTNFNKCGSESNQKFRVVPLPNDLQSLIKAYVEEKSLQGEDYIFSRYNKPIRKWLAEEWFRRAIKMANIDTEGRKLTPHSLRFTYVTRMRRNVDGETVQKLAGHNSMEMTDYYTRSGISELVEAVKPAVDAANRLFA